jgi:hypothetical protein
MIKLEEMESHQNHVKFLKSKKMTYNICVLTFILVLNKLVILGGDACGAIIVQAL